MPKPHQRYSIICAVLFFLPGARFALAQSESSGLKHPNFKTYSISTHTGKYTLCFDDFVNELNQVKAVYLAHQLFDLNQKMYWDIDGDGFFRKKVKRKPIQPTQLRNLAIYLQTIEASIIKYTSKVYSDPAKLKALMRFKIRVENSDFELVQPDRSSGIMKFSSNIVADIYEHAVRGAFDDSDHSKKASEDTSQEETSRSNLTELLDDDSIIYDPDEFIFWIINNPKYVPPCIPYITAVEFLEIIDNKNLFRKDLTQNQRVLLAYIRNTVSQKNFKGEFAYIDQNRGPSNFSMLANMIDWNNAPQDLKDLYNLVKNRPLPDAADDKTIYTMDDMGGYMLNETQFMLASKYITLEIYKYLSFVMAHEFYHAWFAPGEIGPEREIEADRFATYIYLELFSDVKFQALFNFESGQMKRYMALFSSGNGDNNDSSSAPTEQTVNLFSLFLGKPIDQIFKEVYEGTEFYEKPSDGFHLSIKDRENKMKEITSNKSAAVLNYLNNYFKEKLKSKNSHEKATLHHTKS